MPHIFTSYETRGRDWNEPSQSCARETQPFFGLRYPAGTPMASVVVNKVFSRIRIPVYLLDVTTLSQYRKDGHPSYYGGYHSGLDCSHWCLPGLPDTWNQLLYAALISWTCIGSILFICTKKMGRKRKKTEKRLLFWL